MARILFLTQVLPYPLDAGPKVRQYHMLRHLSQEHQVTLVCFVRSDDTPEAVEHLKGICHAVYPVPMRRSLWRNVRAGLKGLLTGLPMTIVRDEIGEMNALLGRLMRETAFDVVHTDQLSMSAYGLMAAAMVNGHRPRTLLDEHNAIYLLAQRMAETESSALRRIVTKREARAFARYEASMCRAFDALLTVIPDDREHLLSLLPTAEQEAVGKKFTVVPICVDPDREEPVEPLAWHPPTILHLGTMFWPPNIHGVLWFAREVLPLIHQRIPDAQFVVVGKDPPPEVQALQSDSRIQVTGYVVDLAPYLAQTDAFVVPLHAGSGMRVKILDAWVRGLPIVSTRIGAEGIQYREGENILIAADAQAFSQACTKLLTDSALNHSLRTSGRTWVESHYSWEAVYRQVDEVYARLLGTL
jgi:glycosyltransferase involved in cell wall biosynthesis